MFFYDSVFDSGLRTPVVLETVGISYHRNPAKW